MSRPKEAIKKDIQKTISSIEDLCNDLTNYTDELEAEFVEVVSEKEQEIKDLNETVKYKEQEIDDLTEQIQAQ